MAEQIALPRGQNPIRSIEVDATDGVILLCLMVFASTSYYTSALNYGGSTHLLKSSAASYRLAVCIVPGVSALLARTRDAGGLNTTATVWHGCLCWLLLGCGLLERCPSSFHLRGETLTSTLGLQFPVDLHEAVGSRGRSCRRVRDLLDRSASWLRGFLPSFLLLSSLVFSSAISFTFFAPLSRCYYGGAVRLASFEAVGQMLQWSIPVVLVLRDVLISTLERSAITVRTH